MKMTMLTQKNGNFKFEISDFKNRRIHTYLFDEYAQPSALSNDQPQLRRFDVFELVRAIYACPENPNDILLEGENFYYTLVAQGAVSFSVKSTELEQTMRKHLEALLSKNYGVHDTNFDIVSGLVPRSAEKYVFEYWDTKYHFYELSEEDRILENVSADTDGKVWMRVQYRDEDDKKRSVVLPFSVSNFKSNITFSESVRLQFIFSPFFGNHDKKRPDEYKRQFDEFRFLYPDESDISSFENYQWYDKFPIESYSKNKWIYPNAA